VICIEAYEWDKNWGQCVGMVNNHREVILLLLLVEIANGYIKPKPVINR